MPRLALILITVSLAVPRHSRSADEIDFARDIRPILSDNCYHCHGPDANTREADLRLDTEAGLFQDQDDVAIVRPGDVEGSELIRRVVSGDEYERMPPVDSQRILSAREIDLLKRWVASGAPWEGHWSYQPIVQPPVPTGGAQHFPDHTPQNAIDYFVLRRLAEHNLSPSPPASKERLLRRVTLDLTGLPPTLEEIDAFLADESPGAYEREVDRLLKSPHYGERMGWDWLNAARYADTNGFQGDSERTMWPWRDWVVQAFNRNMPYDDFTIWQLAGDLLPDATPEQQLATGFCRNHMINGEGGRIPEENRVEYVFDQMETMGTVWMGLTLQCSRCHDHKFDPFTRQEYYQLFAFFNQTPVDGSGRNPQTPPVIAYATPEQQAEIDEWNRKVNDSLEQVAEAEKTLLEGVANTAVTEEKRKAIQSLVNKPVANRNEDQLKELEKFGDDHAPDYAKLLRQFQQHRRRRDKLRREVPRVMVMEDKAQPRKTYLLTKGLYNQPTDEVAAGTPAILPALPSDAPRNRLALAKWLVDPSHPLAARVTVNRYWQLFFGTGFVKTTEDFGQQGERPSHPELLDWLAAEFIRTGWDVKRLHKTIVMSATYRQTAKIAKFEMRSAESENNPQSETRNRRSEISNPKSEIRNPKSVDPNNRLLTRGPRSRMPSWMIRDHALAASGLLERQVGGPPVNAYQPAGVWAEATFGKKKFQPGQGDELYRRSIYLFWRRIIGPTMFFDSSKRQTCTVRVPTTNTPLHALTTMNDVTYVEAARAMAARVMKSSDQDTACLEAAFRIATSRRPTESECAILRNRLDQLKQQYSADPRAAKQLLAVGESPRDQSLNAIEHAAYTGICSLLLNLDESLTK